MEKPKIRMETNFQSLAYTLKREGFVAIGVLKFLPESEVEHFCEIPIKELENAGYEETFAYNIDHMSELKKLFRDYILSV